MIVDKLSTLVFAQVALTDPQKVVSVLLWINESLKDNLHQYGIDHKVPGFLVLANITIATLDNITHEDWLMLVTQGILNVSRRESPSAPTDC